MATVIEEWGAEPSGRGVADARSRVDSIAARLGYGPDRQRLLVLLASETVTNAVVHGLPPVRVGVELTLTGTRVYVTDASSDLPFVRSASRHAAGGRGLALVNRFATSWGTRLHALDTAAGSGPGSGPGKTVWFELDHPNGTERYEDAALTLSTTTSSSRT